MRILDFEILECNGLFERGLIVGLEMDPDVT